MYTLKEQIEELKEIEKMKNDNFGFISEEIESQIDFKEEIQKLENKLSQNNINKIKKIKKNRNNRYFRKTFNKQKKLRLKKSGLLYVYNTYEKEKNNRVFFKEYTLGSKFFKNVSNRKIRRKFKEKNLLKDIEIYDNIETFDKEIILNCEHQIEKDEFKLKGFSCHKSFGYWNIIC